MGTSDIKAGGAFIEIGTRMSGFMSGLNAAGVAVDGFVANSVGKLREVGESLTGLGGKLMGLGGAMLAPLALSVKTLADYGESMSKLASKTGMSQELLAGLSYAAETSGISVSAVATSMKSLRMAVVDGSKDSAQALKALGLSAEALKGMTPDEQFKATVDALARVADESTRSVIGQKLLGRGYQELVPLIEGGRAALDGYVNRARDLNLVLGAEQATRAAALDTALDDLGASFKGLKLAIGDALAEDVSKLVTQFTELIRAAIQWVKANPDVVQSFAKIGTTVALAGAGFVALGMAITAALSPAFMATAAIMMIGGALLSVTDILGFTQTGFGELFNSIRIGGTGLGTWWSAFVLWMAEVWNKAMSFIEYVWDAFINTCRDAGSLIYEALVWVPKKLLEAFRYLVDYVGEQMNGLTGIYNDFAKSWAGRKFGLGTIDMKFGSNGVFDEYIKALDSKQNQIGGDRAFRNADYVDQKYKKLRERSEMSKELSAERERVFVKDPQDNTTGIAFDKTKFMNGLESIGGNVWDQVKKMWEGVQGILPAAPASSETGAAPPLKDNNTQNAFGAAPKDTFAALGTFSGAAVGQMGVSGVFKSLVDEQRETNRYLSQISKNTSETGLV